MFNIHSEYWKEWLHLQKKLPCLGGKKLLSRQGLIDELGQNTMHGLTTGIQTETIPLHLFNYYFGIDTYSLKVMNDTAF